LLRLHSEHLKPIMTDLDTALHALAERFERDVAAAHDERALDHVRVSYLGRAGELTVMRRGIGGFPPDQRPNAGKVINVVAAEIESKLTAAQAALERSAIEASLGDTIDVTFPGPRARIGTIHPVRAVMADIARYFSRHGFAIVLGPEIETDANNFDALNIPPDHPAREGFDSFYLRPDLLLRTHTSPMQIRAMRRSGPPIAIIVPGKAYRRDAVDARHLYQFHQVEGLMVGTGIHFGHLKGMLTGMMRELFGPAQEIRFRPSFFPFTEPSAEVDVSCPGCGGGGCRTCGGSGWIEIGGAGMVHPNVLQSVGYDADAVTGWAFGCGLERIAMKKYDVNDIREFVENRPAFLEQLA
jgi:phenylalanyl-tRNA synthetase alpha chain